jgi:hypothetical protein
MTAAGKQPSKGTGACCFRRLHDDRFNSSARSLGGLLDLSRMLARIAEKREEMVSIFFGF